MAASDTSSLRLSLPELEKVLFRELCDTDLLGQLPRKLSEHQVISKEVYRILVSLDIDRLEVKLIVRYLLRHVWEKVESEDTTFSTFIEVLSELGLHSLCETLTLAMSTTSEATGSPQEGRLLAKDIPLLMTKLAKVTFKWRDICIAVGLPMNVLMECENRGDNVAKLYHVIWEWVTGNHEYARSPTLSNLNECLTGPLVRVPEISLHTSISVSRKPQPENQQPIRFKIVYISGDCEVADTQSTLLEARASIVEGVNYRWMKDGECLSDGEDYCGTSTDILVIKHAHQGMEGDYTCSVVRGEEKLVSEVTRLKILCSQEKEYLLNKYASQREVPRDKWPPVITNTFTNLVLVKQTKKHQNEHPSPIQGNVDDIVESKEEISYESVFGTYQSGSLVLVEGRPGSGKTTLVHKVVRDWAIREGTLKGAKLVFLVRLRLLQSSQSCRKLSDLLNIIYSSLDISSRVASYIETVSGDRVCIILDGLDEYAERDMPESIIYKLTRIKSLYKAMVIVTSRPVATRQLRESDIEIKRTEVLGFNREQICHYISNYPFEFQNAADTEVVISKINSHFKSHPELFHMCSLPVQAAMICYLFQDFQGLLPITETKMYFEFTKSLILRSLRRKDNSVCINSFDDMPILERKNFLRLCHLAFIMIIQSQQVAYHSKVREFISCANSNDTFSLGLMNIEHFSDRRGQDKIYSFLHLTLQEYLAAYYIASLSDTDCTATIQKYGRSKGMYKVWLFFFGIVSVDSKLVDLVKQFPYDELFYPFLFQCAFESQLQSVCEEVISIKLGSDLSLPDLFISPMDFIAIQYVLADNPPTLHSFSLWYCIFDRDCGSQFVSFVSSKCDLRSLQNLTLSHCDFTSKCMLELIKSIRYNKCLDSVILSQCGLSSEGLVTLANWMKDNTSVTHLDISGNPLIDYEGMVAIAEVLESDTIVETFGLSPCDVTENPLVISNLLKNNNTIHTLLLRGYCEKWKDDFSVECDSFMVAFMEGLQSNSFVAKLIITSKLDIRSFISMLLCNCTISFVGLEECVLVGDYEFSDVNQRAISLRHLSISISTICSNTFFSGLKLMSELKRLTIDNVAVNSVDIAIHSNSAAGFPQNSYLVHKLRGNTVQALAAGLCHSNLRSLSIQNNDIGPELVPVIVDLISRNKSIQNLHLSSNLLGSDGVIALATDLIGCDLTELSLPYNNIGPEAGKAIADIINNNQIIEIHLWNNEIGSDGIIELAAAINRCCLQKLIISGNNIGPEAGKAIASLINDYQSIKTIGLHNNKLGSKGIIELVAAIHHCSLEELNLSNNSIGPDAGKAIADLIVNNKTIEKVHLSYNELGSDGVIALAAELKNCCLMKMDLSFNHIDSIAGKALANLIDNNRIHGLSLRSNNLGVDGIKSLAKHKLNSSTRLDLSYNNISPVCEAAILRQ